MVKITMNENEKKLPTMKVRVGEQVFSGEYDAENGVVKLEDGRIVRVPQQSQQKPKPEQPKQPEKTELEKKEEKERLMRQQEKEKEEALKSRSKINVSVDKKAEAARKKQEEIEKRNQRDIEKKNEARLKKEEKMAQQIEKREAKANAKVAGDANSYSPQAYKKNIVLTSVLYVVVIFAIIFMAGKFLNSQQEEVSVIRLKSDMLSGEVIRETSIEEYKMLKKSYDELGTVKYVSSDGTSSVKQIIYTWEQRDEVIGKYMTNYTQGGQYLTLKNVTDKKIVRNPWLAELKEHEEVYTLPISTNGLNTRLLLPGTHLRVRVVIQTKDAEAGTSVTDNPFDDTSMEDIVLSTDSTGENDINKEAIIQAGGTIPEATVAFDDVCAVDMLNGSGESLFDIYMALSKLPVEERLQYLETTIEGNATNFQSRVTPSSLVLILTRTQATRLAEFENMKNATIKYTILPFKDENGSLLSSFTEIADQMNDIIELNMQG